MKLNRREALLSAMALACHRPPETPRLKTGDVVRHRVGGPPMTVVRHKPADSSSRPRTITIAMTCFGHVYTVESFTDTLLKIDTWKPRDYPTLARAVRAGETHFLSTYFLRYALCDHLD
jgi:hypothetical protein